MVNVETSVHWPTRLGLGRPRPFVSGPVPGCRLRRLLPSPVGRSLVVGPNRPIGPEQCSRLYSSSHTPWSTAQQVMTAEGPMPRPSRTRSWAPAVNHDLCRGGPNNASQRRPRARSLVVDHQASVRTTRSAPRQASYGRGVSLTAPDGEGAATFLVRCESLSRSRRISTTDPLSSSSSAHTHTGSELARWTLRSHWSYSFFAPPNSSRRLVSPVSRNSRASASTLLRWLLQHELRSGHPVSRCGARSTQTNESRAAQPI
jgi:hypothetical protein